MIVEDAVEAARIVAGGGRVLMAVDPSAGPVAWPAGPGRMAVFVGEAGDPAAAEMEAELLVPRSGDSVRS